MSDFRSAPDNPLCGLLDPIPLVGGELVGTPSVLAGLSAALFAAETALEPRTTDVPLANEANLHAWLKKLEARDPQTKSRYRNFYAFLDQDVPRWTSIVTDPSFLVWGSARDQRTGSCLFDMMFDCWDEPTWKGRCFPAFMRMFLRDKERARSSGKGFLGRLLGSKTVVQPADCVDVQPPGGRATLNVEPPPCRRLWKSPEMRGDGPGGASSTCPRPSRQRQGRLSARSEKLQEV